MFSQGSNLIDPIQFNSCFISFSYSDKVFATKLHSYLRNAGVRVWFSPKNMHGGKKLLDQIDHAIRSHDLLLLILSKASMRSNWVVSEIRRALEAEAATKHRRIFPIRICDMASLRAWTCFDADSGKDLAVQIREYFIPDFSGWENPSAFKEGLGRLLDDLRSNG